MNNKLEYKDGFTIRFSDFRRPSPGHITVIRTQDEIMFVDDLNPDIISVHPSNTQHSDETEEEYLERMFKDKPYLLYWIKRWSEKWREQ